jgi:3'-phosphoadenosine 5'-phosphosulfate sulfotransferase (PAPS reductase)/FAD synthetase
MQQLTLDLYPRSSVHTEVFVPGIIDAALHMGAALAISNSGGKDSQAMTNLLPKLHREKGYPGSMFAIFADLGRIEWAGTLEHCKKLARHADIPLVVVRRPQGGMIERWEQRMQSIAEKDQDKPFWSSSANRYCTDSGKIQQIDKELRKIGSKPFWSSSANRYCTAELKRAQVDKDLRSHDLVICAVGIRAQESPNRAKEPRFCVRNNITAEKLKTPTLSSVYNDLKKTKGIGDRLKLALLPIRAAMLALVGVFYDPKDKAKYSAFEELWAIEAFERWRSGEVKGRFALTWNAILDFDIEQVWKACGTSTADVEYRRKLYKQGFVEAAIAGFPAHWAYITSSTRLSCSQCVLGSAKDTENGAKHNLEVWVELVEMEIRSGWTFKNDFALASLQEQVGSMSDGDRYHLHEVLIKLGLVSPLPVQIAIELLSVRYLSFALSRIWAGLPF